MMRNTRPFRKGNIGVRAAFLLCVGGCASPARTHSYETLPADTHRDSVIAQQHNAEGLKLIEQEDYDGAADAFRKALEADLWYAPAHNNLGLALLEQGRAYEASWELHYAAKLMPEQASPIHNLGLVMERVGKYDEAIGFYQDALELAPGSIETMGHLARTYIKSDRKDANVEDLLEELALRGSDTWDVWARSELIRLGK